VVVGEVAVALENDAEPVVVSVIVSVEPSAEVKATLSNWPFAVPAAKAAGDAVTALNVMLDVALSVVIE
jgi:hypothetical protein